MRQIGHTTLLPAVWLQSQMQVKSSMIFFWQLHLYHEMFPSPQLSTAEDEPAVSITSHEILVFFNQTVYVVQLFSFPNWPTYSSVM